jgi:DNA-binding transcriptional LysR family regulator
MVRNLDIALLRTFVAIVDQGSVTAAALHLHLTQSAVSQQLRRLEALLQVQLVVRDHTGSRPTSAGERLLGGARDLLMTNDRLWTEMTGCAIAGRIRLGAPEDIVSSSLHPILGRSPSLTPLLRSPFLQRRPSM